MKWYSLAFGLLTAVFTLNAAAQTQPGRGQEGGAGGLSSRIERLEEQLVGLQGAVAAVETLAKNSAGGGGGYAAASGGASAEQIRQLSEQIADLTQRLERLEARLGASGGAGPAVGGGVPAIGGATGPARASQAPTQSYGDNLSGGFSDKEPLPPLNAGEGQGGLAAPATGHPPRVGQPQQGGPVAQQQGRTAYAATTTAPVAAGGGAGAKALFDQAFSAFNRREYTAAQTYFEQYLQQYPNEPQAATAQFYLGEAAFISGEYRLAADRFLKVFTNYPSSDKGAEAMLKLAISLRRMGETAAACDSFAELVRRYPQAPASITQRAETEKRRANCS